MPSGNFVHKIDVYGLQHVDDPTGYGNGTDQQILKFSTTGEIVELNQKDLFLQGMSTNTAVYQLRIRYAPGRELKKDDQVNWNGKTYIIRDNSLTDPRKTRFLINKMELQS